MDPLRQHEISEAGHRILNPFTEEKLRLLGEVCRLQPGQRQLDLACGKGEMLCRWAEWFGVTGVGIDISEVFVPAALARAAELGVGDRVRFERADASSVAVDQAAYDVVSCIGATWIGGGVAGTIHLMRPALRPGGLLLVGEAFWYEDPPEQAYGELGVTRGEFTSLLRTQDRIESAGAEIVEMVLADGDSWDRYVAAQWGATERWLRTHPDHPDAPEMRGFRDQARRSYLAYGRRYLGWGVFVLQAR